MRSIRFHSRMFVLTAAMLIVAGCKGAGGAGSSPILPTAGLQTSGAPLQLARRPIDKIKHIVILIQANRSLNNLFYDYPGAMTAKFGYGSKGQKIRILPLSLATKFDLEDDATGYFRSCNGTGKVRGSDCRMNGFDRTTWTCGHGGKEPKCPSKYPPYSYVPHDEVQPYFAMAQQYVLAAQMFASNFDESSFISQQYLIAGVNPDSSADYPETAWGCPGGPTDKIDALQKDRVIKKSALVPCWNPPTLAKELDKKGISWAYYGARIKGKPKTSCDGVWSAFQAIKYVCDGSDWAKDIITPPTQFLADVKAGNLRTVTWIQPRSYDSDHAGNNSKSGPLWVTRVVNAVGRSQFWDSTAIFILWDSPGGWYDPVAPAHLDDDGLGFRIPMLIISPYAKEGWVSQVHYEHGSILKFIEDRFGLPRLAASDRRANSPEQDCFDFSQRPRRFVGIKPPSPESYVAHEPPDDQPTETNE